MTVVRRPSSPSSQQSSAALQLAIWGMSAVLIAVLLPMLAVFWMWSFVTGYSAPGSGTRGAGRLTRDMGRSRYVRLKDVKLHYVETGDRSAPLMLCLHGFPEFWFSWRHQLKEFASTHWVVAPDMRGYGHSDRPDRCDAYRMDQLVDDVRQIIEKLGRTKCDVLLAHDWGAGIGWYCVHKHPDLFGHFVPMAFPHPAAFVSIASTEVTQLLKSWYMLFFQLPVVPEFIVTAFDDALLRWMLESSGRDAGSEDSRACLEYFKNASDFTGPINYYRNFFTDTSVLGVAGTMKIKVPTLLIWGEQDHYLNSSMAPLSAKWVEKFQLLMIPNSSHWVHQQAYATVNQSIRQFVNE